MDEKKNKRGWMERIGRWMAMRRESEGTGRRRKSS